MEYADACGAEVLKQFCLGVSYFLHIMTFLVIDNANKCPLQAESWSTVCFCSAVV